MVYSEQEILVEKLKKKNLKRQVEAQTFNRQNRVKVSEHFIQTILFSWPNGQWCAALVREWEKLKAINSNETVGYKFFI